MPDILADYREWRSKQEDRIGTHSDRCHMWQRHERCMIHRLAAALAAEQAKRTLTDSEREAIALVIRDYGDLGNDDEACEQIAAALRGLLERTDRT